MKPINAAKRPIADLEAANSFRDSLVARSDGRSGSGARVVRDLRDGVPDGPDVIREVLAVCSRNEDADLIVAALNRAGN